MTAVPRKPNTILLADDEPYNLQWVIEYLKRQRFVVVTAESVDKAIEKLQEIQFRLVIADLSIPLLAPQSLLADKSAIFQQYPGLLIADYARNHGHLGRQVIVYSVHDDAGVKAQATSLGCTFLLKGRPRQFKDELDDVLSYDPLAKKEL